MSKILIIEDDIAIAEIERDYLEINGFEVKIETDGVSGMNTALKGGFQLVLLDLMLPEIDGFTVCRSLREHLDIPILMVTAKKEDIDKIRGLGLGADDYIVKPFSPGELVARVQAHIATYNRLKGGIQEIQPEITVGAIRINPKSHRVFVKEREISLKNKEYELLLFLVTNADMVLIRKRCMSEYGAWTLSVIMQQWQFILTGSVKKSRTILPIRIILKQFGVRDIVSERR